MNHRQLEAFNTFMLQGSVTKAAKILGVSQPAISRLLNSLEKEVSFRMFDRKRNFLAATEEARTFHKVVVRSFNGIKEIESQAEAIANKQVGSINIVAQPICVSTYLVDVVAKFKILHPNIEIILHDEGVEGVLEKVSNRSCDLGIGITLNLDSQDVDVTNIFKCRAVCLLPFDHALKNEKTICAEQIKTEQFVELSIGSPLRMRTDNLFYTTGILRNITAQARTVHTVYQLVERGVGIAIVDPFVRLLMNKDKTLLKLFEPVIEWDLALLTPAGIPLNEIERAFVRLLKKHLREVDKLIKML